MYDSFSDGGVFYGRAAVLVVTLVSIAALLYLI
jgi:hypothetical protein